MSLKITARSNLLMDACMIQFVTTWKHSICHDMDNIRRNPNEFQGLIQAQENHPVPILFYFRGTNVHEISGFR